MSKHAIIIGAGPAGLCLSLALARRGLEVDVIERQDEKLLAEPAFDGREVALNHASMRLLRELGVWSRIAPENKAPLRQARIMDRGDRGFLVEGMSFGKDRLGTLVSNCHIRKAAWEAVNETPGIHVHTGVAVKGIGSTADHAWADLDDERHLEAALMVAADSRFSAMRRQMGITTHMHDFGQTMLLCRMRHPEYRNDGEAWEWFGDGFTRALLPLGEHLSSTVLTVAEGEAAALREMSQQDFEADMTRRYEGRLGPLERASTVHTYPLVGTWAHRFTGERFALAGDAAIGMHPVTAHGFNLGLASVEHLASAVGDAVDRGRDPADPAFLARYQRRQRMTGLPLFAGTRTVVDLFTSKRHFIQPLRHAIIGTGRRVPPLRRALAAAVVDDSNRGPTPWHHARKLASVLRPRPGHGPAPT